MGKYPSVCNVHVTANIILAVVKSAANTRTQFLCQLTLAKIHVIKLPHLFIILIPGCLQTSKEFVVQHDSKAPSAADPRILCCWKSSPITTPAPILRLVFGATQLEIMRSAFQVLPPFHCNRLSKTITPASGCICKFPVFYQPRSSKQYLIQQNFN
jgi:hypothetical protein